ncbi:MULTISPECIES: AAA-like domain-containing protein [unclassified Picosynechococcus]|uniref:AAA-like domain-containing protein n=1 Tax=unclassified Picosynechococcus TaxID=3079910 RepID=UPI0004AA6D2C|nr:MULTISPECIES: AAA-like domain-containing protein [unclassified Picosynechococcus]ANV88576.1 hypothetical protein AWQ22_14555 [Picosynechococcus sp. PCC 7117]
MSDHLSSQRKRGVVLSAYGRQRLQQAIRQVEETENQSKPLLFKEISQRAGISAATISRIWSNDSSVDRRSLVALFRAFDLELDIVDYQFSEDHYAAQGITTVTASAAAAKPSQGLTYPSGPLPLDSPFYIPRPPLETRACHEIEQPGCVVRLKAPSGFGKRSLLLRILAHGEQLNYGIAFVDLKQADPDILADSGNFLRWFCSVFALSLGRSSNLEDHWSDILGNTLSATTYVREQLLEPHSTPLLLSIQELHRLFVYPASAQAFLPMLRSWHEESRRNGIWGRLRQVVTYATDHYLPLDINQSPFNIGLPLLLSEFTPAQVQTLAQNYGLSLESFNLDRLFALLGGHPYLLNLAFYHLSQADLSFDELINTAATPNSIFYPYLRRLLVNVQDGPEQTAQLKTLVMGNDPVSLDTILAYQLEAAGLIKRTTGGWFIKLNLYRDYLTHALSQT